MHCIIVVSLYSSQLGVYVTYMVGGTYREKETKKTKKQKDLGAVTTTYNIHLPLGTMTMTMTPPQPQPASPHASPQARNPAHKKTGDGDSGRWR